MNKAISHYQGMRENKPVIVFFGNHNETFKNVATAGQSLDVPEHFIFDAIKKGYEIKTASGTCFVDWLEE